MDTGPNDLQNAPELFSFTTVDSTIVVGRLRSKALQTYRIEYFSNLSFNASTYLEAETFLEVESVTTDALVSPRLRVARPGVWRASGRAGGAVRG